MVVVHHLAGAGCRGTGGLGDWGMGDGGMGGWLVSVRRHPIGPVPRGVNPPIPPIPPSPSPPVTQVSGISFQITALPIHLFRAREGGASPPPRRDGNGARSHRY